MSSIDEAAKMNLMEGKYDPKKSENIVGGAYIIRYYGEEDRQRKTDVREALRGGGKGGRGGDNYNNPISVKTTNT